MIILILIFATTLIAGLVTIYFYAFRSGKNKAKQEITEKTLNETIEVKKGIVKRAADSIDTIRKRMSKYSRKS